MTYCLGCDLGVDTTMWSRRPVGGDGASSADGSVPSAVGADPDGGLRVVEPDSAPNGGVTTGFVDALGGSEPIIVSGTPYGVEALVGCVLAEVVAVNVAQTGAAPAKFALVHDDGLDPYHLALLNEAARTAGISSEQLMLVSRSDAAGAHVDGDDENDDAGGAAAVAVASLSTTAGGAAGVSGATAAGAGAAGAAGAAGGAAAAAGTAGATGAAGASGAAAAGAVGPLGAAVGPVGAAAMAGPGGAIVGPAGAAVGPAGAGAAGVAGPAGASGLSVAAGGAGHAGAAGGSAVAAKASLPWIPIAIAGGVAAVIVAVVGVSVLAGGGDDTPEAEAPIVTTVPVAAVVTEPVATEPVDEPAATTAAETTSSETTVEPEASTIPDEDASDLSPFEGTWEYCLSEDGVSADIQFVLSVTGPAAMQLDFTASGGEGGCGTGTVIVQQTSDTLSIDSVTTDGGSTTMIGMSDEGPFNMTVEGDTLTVIPPEGGDTFVMTRT